MNRIAIITAFGLALMGCTGQGGTSQADKDLRTDLDFSTERSVAAFTLDGSASTFESDSDLTVACRMTMVVPERLGNHDLAPLRQAIAAAYGSSDTTSVENFFRHSAEEFGFGVSALTLTDSAASALEKRTGIPDNYEGFVCVNGFVGRLTPSFMSYAVYTSSYAPRAAHGSYAMRYVNYDLEAGKLVTLQELIQPESRGALLDTVRSTARRLADFIGMTWIQDLPENDNFTISANGDLVFVYQPYEAASFAQGLIEIPVEPYTIEGMLTDYGRMVLLKE